MNRFSVANLQTADGPQAAIEVKGSYYLLRELLPALQDVSTRLLFAAWDEHLTLLTTLADRVYQGDKDIRGMAIEPSAAHLLAPILYPDKLLAVGGNYSGHLQEMGMEAKKGASMPFFLRPPTTTLVGAGDTVRIPTSTKQFDWECEVAVVVGRTLSHASPEEASAAIAGYAIGLDLSCRDLIHTDNALKTDLVRGKAQDTMGPCGPSIVPVKFVPDVNNLRIQLWVNDEKMMDASTSGMIYKPDEQLSIISEFVTLAPGDILFTGSPSGSAGVHGNRWLRPGDRIRASIEHIGVFEVGIREAALCLGAK